MNHVAETGAAAFLSRYEGLRGRLPGPDAPRAAAAALLREKGLPTPREEAWKYTDLRPLLGLAFREPLTAISDGPDAVEGLADRLLPRFAAPRLVFVDGRLHAGLSDEVTHIRRFADRPDMAEAAQGDRVAAVNAMLAEDGAVIEVPAGVDAGTVMLCAVSREEAGRKVGAHPRHRVTLGVGASLRVLEVWVGEGAYLHNPVMEIDLAADSHLTHVRLQREAPEAFHLSSATIDLHERATYDSFLLGLGGRLSRVEVRARLRGEGAVVHLNAAQLLDGERHGDFTTIVSHLAPNGASRQTVKNVLADRSHGVFQGKIEVARSAQKTDGYQMNQALLLSPGAEIDAKPQLQIHADDVKCSHGATVGELDADQLFLLRSRGIDEETARAMLVRGFLAEALEQVPDTAMRSVLESAIETWWEARAA